jgi:hypothetical protein
VSDGVAIARSGIPVVALITDRFWDQSRLVAETSGLPDLPRVMIPYPVAGTGDANLARVACDIAGAALAALALDTVP